MKRKPGSVYIGRGCGHLVTAPRGVPIIDIICYTCPNRTDTINPADVLRRQWRDLA